ncbi:ATP-binding protein [Desulforamulus aquiferis]|uniref:histidine kinase n=2 Tax=Desulforamulus aquiferis TaxID=1397668 RepID=A0AAW7ZF16_9FIRM|nr:ATP-binding protein [Desulforamulus aquiferis]
MAFDIAYISKTDDVLVQDLETKLTRIVDRMSSQIQNQVEEQLEERPEVNLSQTLVNAFEDATEPILDINKGVRIGLYVVQQDEIYIRGYLHDNRPPGGESPNTREQRIYNETAAGIKAAVAGGLPISKLGKTWDDRFLEYLVPINVDSKLVAVVWAQERMHPVFAQSAKARQILLVFTLIVFGFGVGATIFSVLSWVKKVSRIKDGLMSLEKDLNNSLPDMSGEMGQITKAINRMAANLSEKEHMAEQLRRSEYLSELGRFVTDIAHELRSPVSIIQTTVDLMEPRVKNQSDLKECVEMIQKQLDRHSRLTTELLNFGSPTQVKMDPFDLRELVRTVTAQTEQLLRKSNIELKVVTSNILPNIRGDQEKLTQTFINLIINAIQAMPKGGTLTIETFVGENTACVAFSDTGEGIKPEDISKIFQPFFSKKAGGSGLGLAISKKIVESHGGTMQVESIPGNGAKFTLCFPDYQ